MNKTIAFVGTVVTTLVVMTGTAFATSHPTAESAVSGAASSLKDELLAIGVAVLPFAAALVALSAGWRLARRFVRA